MDEENKFLSDYSDESDKDNSSPANNKNAISADLIRGHINTIILRTLYERDKYGYEIIEEIESKSHGQYTLKQPTLYSALKRLENQGYITAYWKTDEVSLGGRRKYYTLTDSGREITERNQAEWEYSRTVIDNLISDRSFDFSQPAPTPVDFHILKKSTSRVPVLKSEDEKFEDEDKYKFDTFEEKHEEKQPGEGLHDIKIIHEVVVVKDDGTDKKEDDTVKSEENEIREELPEVKIDSEIVAVKDEVVYYEAVPSHPPVTAPDQINEAVIEQHETPEPAPVQPEPIAPVVQQTLVAEEEKFEQPKHEEIPPMDAEQRRRVHENYLRLISEPVKEPPREVEPVPIAEEIDTDKLIYNNKPETERDYRNLINKLYVKTVKRPPQEQTYSKRVVPTNKSEDLEAKAASDGLKINSSDFVISSSRKKSYNRGSALLKSSLIITIVLLLEFTICLLFKNELGIHLAYPFTIFAIACAQLLIFGVLYYTDLGKNSRKPTSALYMSACIVVTVIIIFIIFLVSLLTGINFASAGNIFAKLVIPCVVALNIPLFGLCFYALSK
ncbi:MAG: helix-turn-helix transcriptional regulator [Clostridia bacterium]|nr:helix-turn-helix transcriptional regulator [Clostridia bacterium]